MKKPTKDGSFRGEYKFLSNFFDFGEEYGKTITYNGLEASNLEILYVAMKCKNKEDYPKVLECMSNPGKAKRLGRKLELREDWDDVKLQIMEDLIRLKFQIPELKKLLLETKKLEIIEWNYWGDKFWGKSIQNEKGSNHLGKIIMKIREESKPVGALTKLLTKNK